MRVFITCHSSRWGGGISVAQNLLSAFTRIAPENEYLVTIPRGLGYEACCQGLPRCQLFTYVHGELISRWWWETMLLPKVVRDWKPDVVFNMANRGMALPPCPQATLIQDSHLLYPFGQFGRISLKQRLVFFYHRRHLRRSLKRTQVVFCQTKVARDRLWRMYGRAINAELCPNHVSVFTSQPSECSAVPISLAAYQNRFILFVLTRYYPHKNLEIIPEVFRRFSRELHNVLALLTISPDESRQAKKMLERVRTWKLEDKIVTIGPLRQDQLSAFYLHTDCLFLPTLLESFSGTYIEAMRYGRPIITSNMDFARVVCGAAAEYFNPLDPESIFAAILRVRDDRSRRDQLVAAGKKQQAAGPGSWDEIARAVMGRLTALAGANEGVKAKIDVGTQW